MKYKIRKFLQAKFDENQKKNNDNQQSRREKKDY